MASKCSVCGKGKQYGNNVSHSHRKTKRVWIPNIQTVKIGSVKTNVCTACIKKSAS